jgi:glycine/D-amino acid oxidase-like deaminating enzyme
MIGRRALWAATAPAGPPTPPLVGPVDCAVAIVGAGFTGLSTALALAARGVVVTVLEADAPGAGASGVNGGQVIPGLRHRREEVVRRYGEAVGDRLYQFGVTTADATFALIRDHAIACDAMRAGWVQAAETPAEIAEGLDRVAGWRAVDADVTPLTRDEVAAITGSTAYLGGWRHGGGGGLQPLALALGLARAAIAAGARVHGGSRVTEITRDGADWRLQTATGRVVARRVLVATTALTGRLLPKLAQALLPVWSYQIATDPIASAHGVLPNGAVVSDTRRILTYFRRDAEHRLVVGGKGRLDAPGPGEPFAVQRRALARLYPKLAGATVRFGWGGQVAVTPGRWPHLFQLGDGLYAPLACNGKGVAWCVAQGPVLADFLTGTPADALPLPPPEPVAPIPLHGLRRAYSAAGSIYYRFLDRHGAAPRH